MALTASISRIAAFLEPTDPELIRAFNELPGGPSAPSPEADVWQYLGTGQTETGEYLHTFRHRCHPFTQARMYENVPALDGFVPQEVIP